MEITEFEKKRAANLIWNGAQDYTISTGFRVYSEDGKAQLYWNTIIGAIHKNYDWKKLMAFYATFSGQFEQGLYESLFWIAFENGAYEKEKDQRPVFPYLRREYARKELKNQYINYDEGMNKNRAVAVLSGHLRHSLGEDAGLPDAVDRKLLKELEIKADLDTDAAIEQVSKALQHYFIYRKNHQEKKGGFLKLPMLIFRRRKGKIDGERGPVRKMAFGIGEHVDEYGSELLDQSHLSVAFAKYSAQTDEGLQEYMANTFGKSAVSNKVLQKMLKDYCIGNHTDAKLHITRGEYTEEMIAAGGYPAKMRAEAAKQREENEKAFDAKRVEYFLAIEQLTARIRNTLMIHLEDQEVKANNGQLNATRIWRALELDDDKVFDKVLKGDNGNLTVDILLDASTSQIHRQEAVSAQGYMIAQALTKCNIPSRVYSFCSLNGYTIVNLFRDYGENDRNQEIFRFNTTGANRDGLAIRLAAGMMKDNHADHRILIVLSDCKPNDVLKVRTGDGQYKDYASTVGVEDTAACVHAARMQGIKVMCVFTGSDESLPDVHRIYGSSFARIKSLDMFADTVGAMLQNEIRMLDS